MNVGIMGSIKISTAGISYGVGISFELTGTAAIIGSCIFAGFFFLFIFGFIIYDNNFCCNEKYDIDDDDLGDPNCDDDGKIENDTYNIAKIK